MYKSMTEFVFFFFCSSLPNFTLKKKDPKKMTLKNDPKKMTEIQSTDNFLYKDLMLEVGKINQKKTNLKTLWSLYTFADKALVIIQFGTLLFSVVSIPGNIGLILSMYTLSFSSICQLQTHLITLNKLIPIYEEHILPKIQNYVRQYSRQYSFNNKREDLLNAFQECQNIERGYIKAEMGQNFVLSNTLRSRGYKKIVSCTIVYLIIFIAIPLVHTFLLPYLSEKEIDPNANLFKDARVEWTMSSRRNSTYMI